MKESATSSRKKIIDIGKDTVGEACRAEDSSESPDPLGANRILDVFCGKWTQPSGRVVIVNAPIKEESGLPGAVAVGDWRRALNIKVQCAAPLSVTILDRIPAIWMKCARRAGGLPHIAFVSEVVARTYYADGIPTSQPVLERLVGILSGKVDPRKNPDSTSQSAATTLLQREFRGKMVGNSDRSNFERLMRLGREFSEQGDYRQASNYYREALK
ncbi:MAG: tetratricopeptide repeat protein, partial [Alphaproteobacteria bacterium]|nr:tetratricopeptide repeat protein [Alphaproteobacteria bacterium]